MAQHITRKDTILQMRLTSQEREVFDKAAQAMGLPTSTWARVVMRQAAERPTDPPSKRKASESGR
jgi:antitoxin component of RelBE/YafQ-DinJ toxin-antitoxin module